MDSSGIRFWYTSTRREHNAGILEVGHFVTPYHVIPPNSPNFVTTGILPAECTQEVRISIFLSFSIVSTIPITQYIPDDGIRVFANALHTHVVGMWK